MATGCNEISGSARLETDANGWPIGFFEATAGDFQGEPLVLEAKGEYEQRLELDLDAIWNTDDKGAPPLMSNSSSKSKPKTSLVQKPAFIYSAAGWMILKGAAILIYIWSQRFNTGCLRKKSTF